MPNAGFDGTVLFLKRWLRNPLSMGAVVPSGRLLAAAIAVLSINFIGDGLRDALDPRANISRR